jgi:lipid-binding SYLF domain-containing protein
MYWGGACMIRSVAQTRRLEIDGKGKHMKIILAATLAATLSSVPMVAKDHDNTKRLDEATAVFSEVMSAPDKGIPQDLLSNARCIVIIPGVKSAAFLVGTKYGKGYVSCRHKGGIGWSSPGAMIVEGGSFGFQIGASDTDVIMLVMNEGGMGRLLSDKFTLGGEASVAAGPVGRTATAETDAQMHAEILSWSRTQGVFAGIALTGASLRQDMDDNAALYGRKLSNREILTAHVRTPKSAVGLIAILNKYSSREHAAVPTGGGQ